MTMYALERKQGSRIMLFFVLINELIDIDEVHTYYHMCML